MTFDPADGRAQTILRAQEMTTVRLGDDEVHISQTDSMGQVEDHTVTIAGRANLDLLIAALQKAREALA